MAQIKTNRNTSERPIKIERRVFDALFITHATWHHLGDPSAIQRPRLNCSDSHPMHFVKAVGR